MSINPQEPIEQAVSELQKGRQHSSLREKFYDTLKNKYPNLHALYTTTSIVLVYSGFLGLVDLWASGEDMLAAPAPDYSNLQTALFPVFRKVGVLVLGLVMLYADDESFQELLVMRKTDLDKPYEEMNARERFFHNFETKYPNIASIYTLFAILLVWSGIWALIYAIPIQPFWRSLGSMILGILLLYLDDLKLDELG